MLRDPSFNTRVSSFFTRTSAERHTHGYLFKQALNVLFQTLGFCVTHLTRCHLLVLCSGAENSDHVGVDVDERQTPRGESLASHWLTG